MDNLTVVRISPRIAVLCLTGSESTCVCFDGKGFPVCGRQVGNRGLGRELVGCDVRGYEENMPQYVK